MPETITSDGEIIDAPPITDLVIGTGALSTITKVELDTQVATAHAYPRSITKARNEILSAVQLDEETALECIYALPRGGKPIRGPSIRLAEIIQQCWGNNRVEARVIEVDRVNKVVVAQASYFDLEKNSGFRQEVRRRIQDSKGRLYTDDMIVVTGNAACSIAARNVILRGVPKYAWGPGYAAAEQVIAGDVKTLSERRDKAIKGFAAFGVKPEQIFAVLDVKGIEEVTLEHMVTLRGMYSSLKDGEITVEEMFDPRRGAARPFEVVSNPLKDAPDEAAKPEATGASDQASPPASAPQAAAPPAAGSAQEVKPDILLIAFERGRDARREGMKRSTPPGEYRMEIRKRELDEWYRGFDSGKPDDKQLV